MKTDYPGTRNYILKTKDHKLNENFRNLKKTNSLQYRIVGNLADGVSYYKYLSFENAIRSLQAGTIALVEPTRWNDAYECLYYEADYSAVSSDYATHPKVYATCMTHKKYDEPAWRIYSGNGNVCIQFEMDRPRLRYELLKALGKEDAIYEGMVKYPPRHVIDNLYKKKLITKAGVEIDNTAYMNCIINSSSPFEQGKFIHLLMLKRPDFKHEEETRLFVIKKSDIDSKTPKALEKSIEQTDAAGRMTLSVKGDLLVLKVNWLNILKCITINQPEDSFYYNTLASTINELVDKSSFNAVQKCNLKTQLKPVSYLVYGKSPNRIKIEA